MLRISGLVCLLMSLPVFSASAADQLTSKKSVSDRAVILHEVDSLASLLSDGVADIGPEPKIIYAASGDAIVLFTMESWSGSNSITQYLAAFTKVDTTGWSPDWPSHRYSLATFMEIGTDRQDLEFEAEDISIDPDNIITVKGRGWGPNDAHCCPSLHKSMKVKYSGYSLEYLGEDKKD